MMKEIRLHGRGGQGIVRAGEIIVAAVVNQGLFGNSIPYFGFERRGAPVSAFVRIDERPIRPKTQVYHPDCLIIMDDTIANSVDIYEGIKDNCILVLNTKRKMEEIKVPTQIKTIALLDATGISLEILKRNIPNTAMLGAFARATGWVDINFLEEQVLKIFDEKNGEMLRRGYDMVEIFQVSEV